LWFLHDDVISYHSSLFIAIWGIPKSPGMNALRQGGTSFVSLACRKPWRDAAFASQTAGCGQRTFFTPRKRLPSRQLQQLAAKAHCAGYQASSSHFRASALTAWSK
jgi:hypothetical protein